MTNSDLYTWLIATGATRHPDESVKYEYAFTIPLPRCEGNVIVRMTRGTTPGYDSAGTVVSSRKWETVRYFRVMDDGTLSQRPNRKKIVHSHPDDAHAYVAALMKEYGCSDEGVAEERRV